MPTGRYDSYSGTFVFMLCLFFSAQIGNKQNNRRRLNQGNGSGVRQQGGQNPIFYNDANTQVGTQIGPSGAFNNQPGGNYPQLSNQKNTLSKY